jgi:hypothetical protein
MKYCPHFVWRQIDIWQAIIALNKTMAIAMTFNNPLKFFIEG